MSDTPACDDTTAKKEEITPIQRDLVHFLHTLLQLSQGLEIASRKLHADLTTVTERLRDEAILPPDPRMTLQEYADSVLAEEFRQPLKSFEDACASLGWPSDRPPVCCHAAVEVLQWNGDFYKLLCERCGKFIADVLGPSVVDDQICMPDHSKISEDVDWSIRWIAGISARIEQPEAGNGEADTCCADAHEPVDNTDGPGEDSRTAEQPCAPAPEAASPSADDEGARDAPQTH